MTIQETTDPGKAALAATVLLAMRVQGALQKVAEAERVAATWALDAGDRVDLRARKMGERVKAVHEARDIACGFLVQLAAALEAMEKGLSVWRGELAMLTRLQLGVRVGIHRADDEGDMRLLQIALERRLDAARDTIPAGSPVPAEPEPRGTLLPARAGT